MGLGGVGFVCAQKAREMTNILNRKSQLAVEYAYQTRDQSRQTWVFWIHASNATRFEQGYRDIANCVKIAGRQNPNTNIFRLVHDWLLISKTRWLLILDNVDDANFLFNTPIREQGVADCSSTVQSLRDCLPQSENGSILITTRSKEAALKLVEQRDIIIVEPMNKVDAMALFQNKLGAQEASDDDIAELAASLEFMPLAMVQAAAYISQRAPLCSVRQYLEKFHKSDHEKTSLLDNEAGQLRRDREAKNSIILTWHITFDHIRQTKPSAADLLSLMSFFDRQGIPHCLVRHYPEVKDRDAAEPSRRHQNLSRESRMIPRRKRHSISQTPEVRARKDDSQFDDDLLTLRNYCLISIGKDKQAFEMHALVQLATKKWLEAYGQLKIWRQQSIRNLNAAFPTGEYENWTVCRDLFPHVKLSATERPEEQESLKDWASILYKAAWYAWRVGYVHDAEVMSVNSMETRASLFGQEHENTVNSTEIASYAYDLGGQRDRALELKLQVINMRKRVLRDEHPDTLNSMSNLAFTYINQGRWKEAEGLEARVLNIRKRVLGDEHPDTLGSISNLALIYTNQGRWKEAEELEVQVVNIRKRVLGDEHPDTLAGMSNLASTYINQGRWKEAEELEVRVISIRKRVLGDEHPDTLGSMSNLALTYMNQGWWKEAEELEVQVINIQKRVLGDEHPETLISMSNLASAYSNQGRWKEAEELGVQVINIKKRVLGDEHPDTLGSMSNLAAMYTKQGRWKEAEELGAQVINIQKRVLGDEHPATTGSMNNLAVMYRNQGRWKEAEEL
jgi:tetratricopeptide (TPR) repeat protein